MSDPFDVDVVIIGAGFSGLTVATELRRDGISFVLLEARDRVGGKTEARHDGLGRLVDTGGQFANDDMTEVLALARDSGATRVDAVHPGRAVTVPPSPDSDPWAVADTLLATLGADDLHDERSVSQWVDTETTTASVREAVRSMVNGGTCNASRIIPVSYLAQLNQRTITTNEELQCWFAETMHGLALHLAAPFAHHIRLECPVRSVHVHDASVDVVALDQVWHAREVVVAAPPTAYASIRFTPGLPDDFSTAAAAFAPGTVLKYLVGYSAPFWLLDGRNGVGQFLDPPGVYFADASPLDSPTLVGFVGGTTAAHLPGAAVGARRVGRRRLQQRAHDSRSPRRRHARSRLAPRDVRQHRAVGELPGLRGGCHPRRQSRRTASGATARQRVTHRATGICHIGIRTR